MIRYSEQPGRSPLEISLFIGSLLAFGGFLAIQITDHRAVNVAGSQERDSIPWGHAMSSKVSTAAALESPEGSLPLAAGGHPLGEFDGVVESAADKPQALDGSARFSGERED